MSYLIPPKRTDAADVNSFVASVQSVKENLTRENCNTSTLRACETKRSELFTHCGHGKSYKNEECPECDALWDEMTETPREAKLKKELAAMRQQLEAAEKEIIAIAEDFEITADSYGPEHSWGREPCKFSSNADKLREVAAAIAAGRKS